jgi:GGDEF domain-containing protein
VASSQSRADLFRVESILLRNILVDFDTKATPDHGTDAQTLVRSADAALYEAKAAGRGSWRFARARKPLSQ